MSRILSAFLCIVGSLAFAADWPNFRGPNFDGISPETGINKDWKSKPPKELWRVSLSDNGFAGPAVAAGKLFIIDKNGDEDVVRAVDLKTGKDVWTFKYAEAYKPPQADWGRGRSTPTYDNGKVYTFSPSGIMHCLDAEKGTKVWSRDVKADFGGRWEKEWWGYTPSPLIDGDAVITCPGGPNASMVKLDKNTGKEIWKGGGSDQAGYATPVIATIEGKKQYVTLTGNNVVGVDAATGALLWSAAWNTSYNVNAATPIVIGNKVFVTSGYGKGCGLVTIADGKATLTWQNKEIKAQFNAPIFFEGHIYGISGQSGGAGDLVCLDPETGKSVWRQTGFEAGGLVAVDGVIIAADGKDGDVVMAKLSPKAFEELGRIKPLGKRTWTAPIVADGKLFVRNMTELVCLDLK